MQIEIKELEGGRILQVHVTGKLAAEDYQRFAPEFERLVAQHGKVRLLVEMRDFHGWDAAGLWEDVKFDAKHFAHIERIAIIGEKTWQKAMAAFCRPFTTARIRYFTHDQMAAARQWLGIPAAPGNVAFAA
jgi:hypothetical protein